MRLMSEYAPMQNTPHKASQKIDQVINRLNTTWDLQIPRLHGLEARKAVNDGELARKCSSRIRLLCWKDVNIDGVVDDFEDRAAQKRSEWVCECDKERSFTKGGAGAKLAVTLTKCTCR